MSDYLQKRREEKINGKPVVEKKRKWLKPVSEKRAAENEVYKIRRVEFLREHPGCQAGLEGCGKKSEEVHHRVGRVGKRFLDETGWLAVCRPCHRWVEMHPVEAKEAGLSGNRILKAV